MSVRICATCGKPFETEQSRSMPFCSPRCKQIDLGRWLDEKHQVPHFNLDPDEEVEQEPNSSD
jgi:endogenous inhibitor of DNA gyrase (YacG/DUF329 family)